MTHESPAPPMADVGVRYSIAIGAIVSGRYQANCLLVQKWIQELRTTYVALKPAQTFAEWLCDAPTPLMVSVRELELLGGRLDELARSVSVALYQSVHSDLPYVDVPGIEAYVRPDCDALSFRHQ